ncbi:MAG TPA: hypothetical protein VNT60_10900, partial [Deinococcales bacterium]|nr:hypothetical protein [Deinococcales bacterium]
SAARAADATTKCGQYTVRVQDLASDYRLQRLTLSGPAGTVTRVEDAGVELSFCQDITNDGHPEALIGTFSGGAHCCFTQHLWSLAPQPRKLLELHTGDAPTMTPRQLDGRGPLELVTYDGRFAYAYGLSFAASPFLPVVYSLKGGRYVNDTRSFPGVLLNAHRQSLGRDDATAALSGTAALIAAGQEAQAASFLVGFPPKVRAWLQSYLPDLRQDLSNYGMEDWPARASLKADTFGVGGSFSAAGTREYSAVTLDAGGRRSLRLFRAGGEAVSASPPLLSTDARGSWQPRFTVRRQDGRDDLVLRDDTSGSARYRPYRLGATASELSDSLATFTRFLGGLTRLAELNERISNTSAPRTAAQTSELQARLATFRRDALAWGDPRGTTLDLPRLDYFLLGSISAASDGPASATWRATVYAAADGDPNERYHLSADLTLADGSWSLRHWTLTPLPRDAPL